jgi:P4 family phage/plasmid primase-like protien
MTIHNQLLSSASGFDPRPLVAAYGPPLYTKRKDRIGALNEKFWAAFYASLNEVIFENREKQFYQFNEKIYIPQSEHLIMDQISNDIFAAAQNWKGYASLDALRNSRDVAGAIRYLKGMVQQEGAFDNKESVIHVANGVLRLEDDDINLLPFSPKLVSRNLIPISYDPKAQCPRFKTELLGLLDEDDKGLLQKFLGLYLLGRNIIQKLLILHGLGETGKSTFSEIGRKLIGPENCSELRTNLLHERFEIGSYVGKHLLIGADVSSSFLNSKGAYRIKAIVGGDLLDAERKGTNYRFQLPGQFNVLVTSNSRQTTKIENDRGPWARRLAIVEYERPRTSKIIPEFAELLIRTEGSGILLWGLEGLMALRADIKAYGTIQLSHRQKERIESLLNESDALRIFLSDRVESALGFNLTSSQLVEGFAGFCLERGWNMTVRKAEEQLPDLMMELFQVARSNNVPSGTTKVRGYRGVKFK